MHQAQNIKLVKGDFKKNEAREIIMNLISSKIEFHNIINQGHIERTGKPNDQSVSRRNELINDRQSLIAYFEGLDDDTILHIQSDVIVEIKTR